MHQNRIYDVYTLFDYIVGSRLKFLLPFIVFFFFFGSMCCAIVLFRQFFFIYSFHMFLLFFVWYWLQWIVLTLSTFNSKKKLKPTHLYQRITTCCLWLYTQPLQTPHSIHSNDFLFSFFLQFFISYFCLFLIWNCSWCHHIYDIYVPIGTILYKSDIHMRTSLSFKFMACIYKWIALYAILTVKKSNSFWCCWFSFVYHISLLSTTESFNTRLSAVYTHTS